MHMKKMTIVHSKTCPYCEQAIAFLDALREKKEYYNKIPLELIDEAEHPEVMEEYDYFYLPAIFWGKEKLHEGACTQEDIENALIRAERDLQKAIK